MADAKISALTGATTPLAGTEVIPVVQSSSTKKVSIADLTAGRAISAADVTVSNLTASRAVATDASKKLVSVANTGTGDNVLATSPTLVTPNIGAATGTSLHVGATLRSGDDLFAKAEMQVNGIAGGQTLFRGTPDGSGFYHAKVVGSRDASTFSYGSQLDIFTEGKNTANGTDTSTSKVTIDSLANVRVNLGNLVIGTAGKGIDFTQDPNPAGMTSELLDDYEEGTWTPTVVAGGLTGVTYSEQDGKYTKIGDTVFLRGKVVLSSKGNGSGTYASIGGVPFASQNADPFSPGSLVYFNLQSGTLGYRPTLMMYNGTSEINLMELDVNGLAVPLLFQAARFTDTTELHFELFFKVA